MTLLRTGANPFSETAEADVFAHWVKHVHSVPYRAEPLGLDLARTERALIQAAKVASVDLTKLLEGAGQHFKGDVLLPAAPELSDSDLRLIAEDELRSSPD